MAADELNKDIMVATTSAASPPRPPGPAATPPPPPPAAMDEPRGEPITAPPQLQPRQAKPTRKKSLPINANNVVLAAMFIAGIVAVYALKLSVKPKDATAAQQENETKVKARIAALSQSSTRKPTGRSENDSVMNALHNDARQRQIPTSVVVKNPFVFNKPKPKPPPASVAGDKQAANRDPDAELLKAKALSDVRRLELQSILTGAKPLAMISSRSLTVGDRISGWTVSAVKSMHVTMTWKDKSGKHTLEYTLKMEER